MRPLIPSVLIPAMLLALPALAQVNQYDSRIDDYVGLRYPCEGQVQPVLRIQNVGGETMTSCDIDILKNGIAESTFNWVLAIPAATGEFRQPALPAVEADPGDDLEFRILTVNGEADQDTTENILIVPMNDEKGDADSYQVQVKVLTDDNPAETSWLIRNANGTVVAQSPGYTESGSAYETPLVLSADQCYNFEVRDSGEDGFGESRELGYCKLVSLGEDVAVAGGDFGSLFRKVAETGTADGCTPSQLTTTADPLISCGATGLLLNGSSTIHATTVPGANKYQFRFTNIAGQPAYARNIAVPTRSLTLTKWATNPLKKGRTYNVQVRASFNNGATWCAYGTSCTVSISNTAEAQPRGPITGMEDALEYSLYPNPISDGRINLLLPGMDEETPVTLEIFSLLGERVVAITERQVAEDSPISIDLPALASGSYVVRVTLGDALGTQRLVVP